jgi:uracil-DNA glycosylase
MGRRSQVTHFVESLAAERPPSRFRNPYRQPEARHNLTTFLLARDPSAQTVLLVGEAPGYRGAALSGVALSSLSVLTDEWDDPWASFGPEAGYLAPSDAQFRRESTATLVWSSLAFIFGDLELPLTWNAVPFHPTNGQRESNAPLSKRDVQIGVQWLEWLIELFPNALPVAVGVRAAEALHRLGMEHPSIRHPSRGGKRDFQRGLKTIRRRL